MTSTLRVKYLCCFTVKIPSPPQDVTVRAYTANTISLEWTAPAANFGKVTGYEVRYTERDAAGEGDQV